MQRNKNFNQDGPLLYLIATPIGNLQEISTRALNILQEMDVIAAEDTRNCRELLNHYGIKKETLSLREHNEVEASNQVIKLLKDNKKVAYMSDAGYPGISDPGQILVQKALQEGIKVSSVSGPSAFLNALVCSGLPTDHFYFYGFLSPKENKALEELKSLKNKDETVILYESPHRIFKTLAYMREIFGNRAIVLARELTKINEEYLFGTIDELLSLKKEGLKGEMVILLPPVKGKKSVNDKDIINRVGYLISKGLSKKDAIVVTSEEMNVNKNYIYKIVVKN